MVGDDCVHAAVDSPVKSAGAPAVILGKPAAGKHQDRGDKVGGNGSHLSSPLLMVQSTLFTTFDNRAQQDDDNNCQIGKPVTIISLSLVDV